MRRGVMLTIDTILAFVVLSMVIYATTVIMQGSFTFEEDQVYSIIRDAGVVLEKASLSGINRVISLTPNAVCIKINVKTYNSTAELSSVNYVKTGCPFIPDKTFISKRTIVDGAYYKLVTVEGWYK